MDVSIICPLYNAEKYIMNLHNSLLMQKNVKIESINYVLTDSSDLTEKLLIDLNVSYKKIKRNEFSHSRVREIPAREAKGDILVFITQDVIIKDEFWLEKLISPIVDNQVSAAFSRQICDNETIEKYIREKNYPNCSRVVSLDKVEEYGIMSFFFSDVSSAISRKVFIDLNAYDAKDLITNEDMYIAYKLINNNHKIMYCAESVVIHSHIFTFTQLFRRYFDTGVFLVQNPYFFKYKANKSGAGLLKHVIINSVKDKNIKVLINVIPNFAARYIGNVLGKNYKKLGINLINKFSSNKAYWKNNKI